MRGLVWTLVWLAILAGSGWYLWRRLRWLWGRSELLGETLAEAEALVSSATDHPDPAIGDAPPTDAAPELAIFRNPAEVAVERERLRETLREERAARRRAAHPAWARPLDSTDASERKA